MKNWWGKGRIIMLVAAGVLLLASVSSPMWSIYLWCNSYPDGIGMTVYTYKPADPPDVAEMDGGIDELDVLNHYIGMHPISPDLIIFKILPVSIVAVGVLLIIAAFWKRPWFLYSVVGLNGLLGLYGATSFVYYIYSYGHDLDPKAAIHVEPFMPPLMGENQLAQFTTWSQFELGTLLLILGSALAFIAAGMEWWIDRKNHRAMYSIT